MTGKTDQECYSKIQYRYNEYNQQHVDQFTGNKLASPPPINNVLSVSSERVFICNKHDDKNCRDKNEKRRKEGHSMPHIRECKWITNGHFGKPARIVGVAGNIFINKSENIINARIGKSSEPEYPPKGSVLSHLQPFRSYQ